VPSQTIVVAGVGALDCLNVQGIPWLRLTNQPGALCVPGSRFDLACDAGVWRLSPDRHALAIMEIEYPQLIDSMSVIGMFMREEYRIEVIDLCRQHLLAKIGRCINEDSRHAIGTGTGHEQEARPRPRLPRSRRRRSRSRPRESW